MLQKKGLSLLLLLSLLTSCARHAAPPVELPTSPSPLQEPLRFLASPQLAGRRAGTEGEKLATEYAAKRLIQAGISAAGPHGYFDPFTFQSSGTIQPGATLTFQGKSLNLGTDWTPLPAGRISAFQTEKFKFAGYGMSLPQGAGNYDSYAHADLTGSWAVVLRGSPPALVEKQRDLFKPHATFNAKIAAARKHGAQGILFITPNHMTDRLEIPQWASIPTVLETAGLPALIMTRAAFEQQTGLSVASLEEPLSTGALRPLEKLSGLHLSGSYEVRQTPLTARNVIGRVKLSARSAEPALLIGAHIDHLGMGFSPESMGKHDANSSAAIHFGADDNASGTVAVLEVARRIAELNREGKLHAQRDLLVALWSAEEEGLIGSAHYVKRLGKRLPRAIGTVLNLDMVGRLREKLSVQGGGSSSSWAPLVDQAAAGLSMPVSLQSDSYLPTDSTSFHLKRIPALTLFTGLHAEYHTPQDTEDKINYPGLEQVITFTTNLAVALLTADKLPTFQESKEPTHFGLRSGMRVTFGTIPDYTAGDIPGLRISGVAPGGPAEKAGLREGDIITAVGSTPIQNIYDYTHVLESIEPGQQQQVYFSRDGKKHDCTLMPSPREQR